MNIGEDPDEFFQRFERLRARLVELGDAALPDSFMLGIVLKNLPDSYKSLIDILDTQDGLTYDILKERLSTYHRRHVARADGKSSGKKSNDEGASRALYTSDSKKKLVCYGCGKAGHFKRDCRKPKEASSKGKSRETTSSGKFQKDKNKRSESEKCESLALTAGMSSWDSDNIWVVDSGCTRHMSGYIENVQSITFVDGEVTVAGGRKLKSIGYGSIHVAARNRENKVIKMVIEDVLIVPNLGPNLLSVERIKQKGGSIHFTQGINWIDIGGHEFEIDEQDGLYTWSHNPMEKSSIEESVKAFMTAGARSDLWGGYGG
jgi:hypothetical protein